nr:protein JINGUBANG-like [Ipomoea batatas]
MNMECYGKRRTLHSFMDEEKNSTQILSPPHHHNLSYKSIQELCDHEQQQLQISSPPSSIATMYSLIPPPSPESPWTLSPLQTPSPSLLYHCITSLHRQDGIIHSVAISKGLVFTGSESSRIRAWRQPDCMERGYIKARCGDVRAMLAYGNTLFTSHKDHKVRAWSVASSSNTSSSLEKNYSHFQAKKIAVLPKKGSSFSIFSRARARARVRGASSQHHKDCVSCMAYYHAGGLLYTGSWDKTVKVWAVSSGRCVDSFHAHDDNVNAVVVNQDDGCVFSCSLDGSVKIWRRVYGQSSHTLTMTLKFQPSPVNALALSLTTSSCFLYSGSSDGFINFWEKEKMSGRFNHGGFLQGHRFAVLCLVAIEKLVFSGSEDTTIRVWRREEGSYFHECLAVLDAHRGPVKCLAVSLEIEKYVMGFLVYSASLDQTFKVWRIKVLAEAGEEKRGCLEDNNNNNNEEEGDGAGDSKTKMEFEHSPVLSPSWVEKKLQDVHPLQH